MSQIKKNKIKDTCSLEDPLERNGNPLQYSYLENPMDRGSWPWQGVTKSQTVLSTYTRTENKRKTEKYGHVNNNITFK